MSDPGGKRYPPSDVPRPPAPPSGGAPMSMCPRCHSPLSQQCEFCGWAEGESPMRPDATGLHAHELRALKEMALIAAERRGVTLEQAVAEIRELLVPKEPPAPMSG